MITGVGMVTPLGHDAEGVWRAMMEGSSGVAETTIFDASTFPTHFSAEVKDYVLEKYTKKPELHRDGNRGSVFVIGAAAQACKQARIEVEAEEPVDGVERSRMGIYLGAGEGSVDNDAFFNAIVRGWNDENREMDWRGWK